MASWLKDMFTSDANGKVSGKKTTFILTWAVASGVVISGAINGTLGFEVFSAYLLFGAGSDAFSKYMAVKNSGNNVGGSLTDK